jgi:hypothetical protein
METEHPLIWIEAMPRTMGIECKMVFTPEEAEARMMNYLSKYDGILVFMTERSHIMHAIAYDRVTRLCCDPSTGDFKSLKWWLISNQWQLYAFFAKAGS